ncbi:MAG: hypothetical protein M0Z58_04680 [Nitrospiraceae bacterium]|nr:hypothetical protein [Nitrospiraceae bacterium]
MILEGSDYRLEVEGARLEFCTSSFRTPRAGSVLSPKVYGPELSAMLAATLPAVAVFLLPGTHGFWRWPAMFAAYTLGFLFFRVFVFKKRSLKFTADRDSGVALLGLPLKGVTRFATGEIEGVEAERKTIVPGNPDGLREVEEIALHHFTVLPGLNEPADFYTVRLRLKGPAAGGIEIYSGRDSGDAAGIVVEMKKFLFPGSPDAQAH